jgi:pimeloyl-ACP methyl ester carboxylesterase
VREPGFGGVRRLVEGHGVRLNVFEAGQRVEPGDAGGGPVVVFVHGFPDTHAVWLPVIARLSERFHCIAYDVRGAGESTGPGSTAGYRIDALVSDLVAVIDAISPDRPVHLVGHDWGSVQAWQAVLLAGSDPRLKGRLASYTTISGPALAHYALWVRSAGRGDRHRRAAVARQLAHSWYVLAFQVPKLPELALRRVLASPKRTRRVLGSRPLAPTVGSDARNGLGLYRANLRGARGQRHSLRTAVPVQLVVPTRDAFLTPAVYDDLPRFCADLTRVDLDAGHWVQQSHPDEVAGLIAQFVHAHEPPSANRERPACPDTR